MEKLLLEKMKNGTCDEIDEDMICARVFNALKQMMRIMNNFDKELKELLAEYPDELKLAGFGIVMGVTELTDKEGECGMKIVYGSKKSVYKITTNLIKEIAE